MIGIAVDADGGLRAPVRRNHGGKADVGIQKTVNGQIGDNFSKHMICSYQILV